MIVGVTCFDQPIKVGLQIGIEELCDLFIDLGSKIVKAQNFDNLKKTVIMGFFNELYLVELFSTPVGLFLLLDF